MKHENEFESNMKHHIYTNWRLLKSTVALSLALTLFSPGSALAQAQPKDRHLAKDPYTAQTQTLQTQVQKDPCDCEPKYIELNFWRKSGTTFSSKEVWTLDKGKGTDLLALDCRSTLENILELVDFKNETIKSTLLSGEYKTIEDHAGRTFAEIRTKKGMRYFTIQSRDTENQGIVSINGKIDYELLKNHGNKMLRLYIMIGQYTCKDNTGKPVIESLDSGDLIIPYCDCIQPMTGQQSMEKDVVYVATSNSTTNNTNMTNTTTIIGDGNETVKINDARKEDSNVLIANISTGLINNSLQRHEYECGILDIDSKPDIWKISAYAKVLSDLHLNAEFTSTHSDMRFLDPGRDQIGRYGITTSDFVFDARGEIIHLGRAGIGAGIIFEENAATQKGRIISSPLNGNSNRHSGLAGIVFLVDGQNMSNLSAGAYLGRSNQLGDLINLTARLDNLQIGEIVSIDSRLFFERYNGNFGQGNRFGFEALAAGPQVFGFLSPFIGYEIIGTRHLYDNGNLTAGSRNSILVGIRLNLGN